jgi:hypothetical protein
MFSETNEVHELQRHEDGLKSRPVSCLCGKSPIDFRQKRAKVANTAGRCKISFGLRIVEINGDNFLENDLNIV